MSHPETVLELHLEDMITLRKPHPCGSLTWRVVRLGADIGLLCTGCSRHVLLERRELERRIVGIPVRASES